MRKLSDEGSIPPSPPKNILKKKRTYINQRIRAKEVRVVDNEGNQLGVMPLPEALDKAKEQNLDLVQITDKATPPVCKIIDYGKFLYWQSKKEKEKKTKSGELKGIRLTFKMSEHDMETKMLAAKKFLEKGNKVRIEMKLRGREKALKSFAIEKLKKFVDQLNKLVPIKTEKGIKSEPRGLTTIITKDK